jgi:hypothetical protein
MKKKTIPLVCLFPLAICACASATYPQDSYPSSMAMERADPGGYAAGGAEPAMTTAEADDDGGGIPILDTVLAFADSDPGPPPAPAMRNRSAAPKAAPLPAAQTEEKSPPETPKENAGPRLRIYRASFSILVEDPKVAGPKFLAEVKGLGGYLQNQQKSLYVVRVPATHFDAVVERLRKSGDVVDENLSTEDVTKQVFELDVRIKTAQGARKRLEELLSKAEKTADVLAIEKEIRRLTEEIETLKGSLRHVMDQVRYSTITVNFMGTAPAPRPLAHRTTSPFGWVNAVGVNAAWSMPTHEDTPWLFGDQPMDAPEDFLVVGYDDDWMRAITADDARLWVRSWPVAGGELSFWQKAEARDLVENRKLLLENPQGERIKGQRDQEAVVFVAKTQVGGIPVKYMLVLWTEHPWLSDDRVRTVELVATEAVFDARQKAVLEIIKAER